MTASSTEGPAVRRGALPAHHQLVALRLRDGVAFARRELRQNGRIGDALWDDLFDRLDDLIDALPSDPAPTRTTTLRRGPSHLRASEGTR